MDDLITQEANRVVAALEDSSFGDGPIAGTPNPQAEIVAKRAFDTWVLAEPFCASLRMAARCGDPSSLTPWVLGLRRMVGVSTTVMGGYEALCDLRRLPGSSAVMTAGIAAVAGRRWDNLKAIVADPAVTYSRVSGAPMALLEMTSRTRHSVEAVRWHRCWPRRVPGSDGR